MSFFSDHRLDALSSRLGGDALKSLIKNISTMVRSRVESLHRSLGPSSIWVMKSDEIPEISPQRANHLIKGRPDAVPRLLYGNLTGIATSLLRARTPALPIPRPLGIRKQSVPTYAGCRALQLCVVGCFVLRSFGHRMRV